MNKMTLRHHFLIAVLCINSNALYGMLYAPALRNNALTLSIARRLATQPDLPIILGSPDIKRLPRTELLPDPTEGLRDVASASISKIQRYLLIEPIGVCAMFASICSIPATIVLNIEPTFESGLAMLLPYTLGLIAVGASSSLKRKAWEKIPEWRMYQITNKLHTLEAAAIQTTCCPFFTIAQDAQTKTPAALMQAIKNISPDKEQPLEDALQSWRETHRTLSSIQSEASRLIEEHVPLRKKVSGIYRRPLNPDFIPALETARAQLQHATERLISSGQYRADRVMESPSA